MKNKYLKILVAFLVFLTVNTLAMASDRAVDYSDDLSLMESLGVMAKGEFKNEDVLTRAEFTKLVVNAMQFPALDTSYELSFADVTKADKNYGYIAAAHSAGLITGGADSNFYPDREITLAEAYTISVRMLGYDVIAKVKYNSVYELMAHELDIDNDLYGELTSVLTAGEASKLLANVLSSDRLIISGMVDDSFDYNTSRKSLLELKYDAYKISGLLEQNEFTNIYTASASSNRGEVLISGTTYRINRDDAIEYLGMNVDAYVTSDKKTILNIRPNEENKVLEYTSYEVDTITSSEVWYGKDGRDFDKLRLSPTVKLILNSKAVPFIDANINSLLSSQFAEYTFVDNNGDGTIDIINACTYVIKTADYVSLTSNHILAKDEIIPMVFDPDDDNLYFEIIKSRKKSDLNLIKEWDALMYCESDTALPGIRFSRLYVYSDSVYGKITEVGDEYIAIDGKSYKTIKGFSASVILNSEGDFYTDEYGSVIAFRRQIRDVIGFMPYSIGTEGVFAKYVCRIFTENNRWVTLELADKVNLDGTVRTAEYVKNNLASSQLIEYRVNELGKVISINTADNARLYDIDSYENNVKVEMQQLPPGQYDSLIEQKTFRINYDASDFVYEKENSNGSKTRIRDLRYRSNGKTLETVIGLSTDTIYFFVPTDVSQEDNYAIFSRDDLRSDQYYTVDVYNCDKSNIAGIAVFRGTRAPGQNAGGASNMIIVDEIAQMLVNGEQCHAIKGYANGNSVLIPVSPEYTPQSLGLDPDKFNIINVNYNSRGMVNSITHIYSSASYDIKTINSRNGNDNSETSGLSKFYKSGMDLRDSSIYLAAAQVISNNVEQNKIYVKFFDGIYNSNPTVLYGILDTASAGSVSMYEKIGTREKITAGTTADILPGDYIICSTKWGCANQIIVLK